MLSYESRLTGPACSLGAFLLCAQDAPAMEAQRDRPAAIMCVASTDTSAAGFNKSCPPQTSSIDGYHRKLPRTHLSSTTATQIIVARALCLLSVSTG